MALAIKAQNVTKNFGRLTALDNVDMAARHGKITGLLGPNGAGKTTLIKVLTTLLKPDSGIVEVDGIDVLKDPGKAREKIGLAGQSAAVDGYLTGRETLVMVARLYGMRKSEAETKSDELLERLGLTDAANRQAKTYSGGMKRRLDLGASLVATPKILFLDEPTTGLDPRTRLQLWDIIRELVANGVTILLTTQYLEEADALSDYIYVVDQGKMIAEGTSENLKKSLGQDVIDIKVSEDELQKAKRLFDKSSKFNPEIDQATRRLKLRTKDGSNDLVVVAGALKKTGIKAEELSLHRPSLDDVFLEITGKPAEEKE